MSVTFSRLYSYPFRHFVGLYHPCLLGCVSSSSGWPSSRYPSSGRSVTPSLLTSLPTGLPPRPVDPPGRRGRTSTRSRIPAPGPLRYIYFLNVLNTSELFNFIMGLYPEYYYSCGCIGNMISHLCYMGCISTRKLNVSIPCLIICYYFLFTEPEQYLLSIYNILPYRLLVPLIYNKFL